MPELGCRGQSVVAASHTPTPTDTQWPQQPSSMSTHFYPVWDHLPPRNSSTGMRTPPFEVWHVNQKIQVMSDSTITYLHIIQAARLDYYCLPFTIQCVKKTQPTCTCFHLWSFHMSPGSNTAHSGIPGLWRKSFSTPAHSTITTKQKKLEIPQLFVLMWSLRVTFATCRVQFLWWTGASHHFLAETCFHSAFKPKGMWHLDECCCSTQIVYTSVGYHAINGWNKSSTLHYKSALLFSVELRKITSWKRTTHKLKH